MLQNLLIQKDLVDSSPADAMAIVAFLTYLRLAMAQAAAYINENGITLADYLALLYGNEQVEDYARYSDAEIPVPSTWLVSFQKIQKSSPLAADYLSFMACIDHKDIPQVLLSPGPLGKKEMDAVSRLNAHSFVTRHSEAQSFDLHRLVHLTFRNWLQMKGMLVEWARRAIMRLEEVSPDHEYCNRAAWRTYLPDALYILELGLVARDHSSRIYLEWKLAMC